jgi:hypothetical protein
MKTAIATLVSVTILLSLPQPIHAEDERPSWITDVELAKLKTIGIEPTTDLEVKGNYHWRYRSKNKLAVDVYSCPIGSTVDISRHITLIIAPAEAPCSGVKGDHFGALKLLTNGSAEPLSR